MEVKNSKGLAKTGGVRILMYGSSSASKTYQAIHTGKTIVISSEKADLTLNEYDVDILHITSLSELKSAYKFVEKNVDKYDTVFIDSLTDIGEQIVTELKDSGNYTASDTFKMWADFTDLMVKISKSFRDLQGINVVLIALEESVKNGFDEKIMPQIPAKKAQKKLISLYDIVIRLCVNENGDREFICHSNVESEARDRSGNLERIEPCVFSKKQNINAGLGKIITKALKGDDWSSSK